MEIEEVFEANIVSGGQCGSSEWNTAAFTSNFSVTASITKSVAASSTKFRRRLQPRDGLLALLLRQTFLLHVTRQAFQDALRPGINEGLRSIDQNHVMAGAQHDMRNAMPHLASTDNADGEHRLIWRFTDGLVFQFVHHGIL